MRAPALPVSRGISIRTIPIWTRGEFSGGWKLHVKHAGVPSRNIRTARINSPPLADLGPIVDCGHQQIPCPQHSAKIVTMSMAQAQPELARANERQDDRIRPDPRLLPQVEALTRNHFQESTSNPSRGAFTPE